MTLCKPKHREKLFSAHSAESNFSFSETKFRDKYSRWMSADPAVPDYMAQTEKGEGGIYNLANFNIYHYGGNNPLRYTDPTGAFDEETGTIEGGDTLSQIAEDYNNKHGTNTTVDDWAKANNISDPDKIYAGNHLNAPPGQQSGGGQSGNSAGKSGGEGGFHPPMAMPSAQAPSPEMATVSSNMPVENPGYSRGTNIIAGGVEIVLGGVMWGAGYAAAKNIGNHPEKYRGASGVYAGKSVLEAFATGSILFASGISRIAGANNTPIKDEIFGAFMPIEASAATEMGSASKERRK